MSLLKRTSANCTLLLSFFSVTSLILSTLVSSFITIPYVKWVKIGDLSKRKFKTWQLDQVFKKQPGWAEMSELYHESWIFVLLNIAWHMIGAILRRYTWEDVSMVGPGRSQKYGKKKRRRKTMNHDDIFHFLDSAFLESISQYNQFWCFSQIKLNFLLFHSKVS